MNCGGKYARVQQRKNGHNNTGDEEDFPFHKRDVQQLDTECIELVGFGDHSPSK
jgi:hypothetical protein